jgi:hypothetical protein
MNTIAMVVGSVIVVGAIQAQFIAAIECLFDAQK